MEWREFLNVVRARVRAEVEALLPGWSARLERLSPSWEPARVVYTCADPHSLAREDVLRLAAAGVLSRYGIAALDSAVDRDLVKDGVETPYALLGGRAAALGLALVARSAELYPRMALLHEAIARGVIEARESVYLKTVLPNTFMCREACLLTGAECREAIESWLGIGYAQQLYDDLVDGDDYTGYARVACILWRRARRLASRHPRIREYIEEYRWKYDVVDEVCERLETRANEY